MELNGFDAHLPPDRRVLGEIDDPHRASSQLPQYFVRADPRHIGVTGLYPSGGQPIMAAAAFQVASRIVREVFATTTSVSMVERGAASKGGRSQDWLPHAGYTMLGGSTDEP